MRNVLADLALESEAATALVMRIAGATDRAVRGDDSEAAFRRIAGAVAKYWVCKRAPAHAAEALECLGGNGYVEESGVPRLYREAPLNSIWEGSGNVIALDVLRALHREPESVVAFLGQLDAALGADRHYDSAVARLRSELEAAQAAGPGDPAVQFGARRLAEQMALTLQASLLLRHGHPAVADGFCASRLTGDRGHTFGALPAGADVGPVIERALVKAA